MLDTKIQTPISTEVLTKARDRATEIGFSSINDVIRIMLKQFADGTVTFSVSAVEEPKVPYVSDKEQKGIKKLLENNRKTGMAEVTGKRTVTL